MRFKLLISLVLPILLNAQTSLIQNGNGLYSLKIDNNKALGYDTDAWLPDTMPVAIGNTIKIYNYNVYFEKNQRFGRVTPDWATDKGTEESDGWEFTATIVDTFRIVLYCKFNNVIIDSATTVIITKAKQTINANFIKVGDSTTSFGFDHESDSLQSATNGTLVFVGTQTTNGVSHEGHGGYYYNTFASVTPGEYTTNFPFNNNGVLDYVHYVEHNGLGNPDIVCFRLGINDCTNATVALSTSQSKMEMLVDSLHSQYPNTLIIVSLTSICEGSGAAWIKSYDYFVPGGTLNSFDGYREKMRALWKITHDLYQGGRKDVKIQISYEGLCIDAYNMYENNNCVHPNDLGYYQYGYILSNSLNQYK